MSGGNLVTATSLPIKELLRRFTALRIGVVGDLMLDEYLLGHIHRISPEAPTPILNLTRREVTLGGTGNVARNLRALGASVFVFGALGRDATGDRVLEMLDELGVNREGVKRDASRPSTRKTRLVSLEHGQQVFRFDEESVHAIPEKIEGELLQTLDAKSGELDAVICSDYLKGALTKRVFRTTSEIAQRRGVPLIAAPKDTDTHKYERATVLVPNTKELAQLSRMTIDGSESLSAAARKLLGELQVHSLLVTRGAEGMSLFEQASGAVRRVDIPAAARAVYDVTGAGDTVVSLFTLGVAAGAGYEASARVANIAAGIVVSKRGTACVTPEEILVNAESVSHGL